MNLQLFISLFITLILIIKIISDFNNIAKFKKKFCEIENFKIPEPKTPITVLLLIPVLREQNIIINTLQKFCNLKRENCVIHVVLAGTSREQLQKNEIRNSLYRYFKLIKKEKSKKKIEVILKKIFTKNSIDLILKEYNSLTQERFYEIYSFQDDTKQVVDRWIDAYNKRESSGSPIFYFYTAEDNEGDRATQLNAAVSWFRMNIIESPDVIGVYDADSTPDLESIDEACKIIMVEKIPVCHQPVHFIDFANNLSRKKGSPVMVANALNQTTWTIIRELPRSYNYYNFLLKNDRLYHRNVYLIGHGQFLDLPSYEKFRFPENVITDGIQLGYRLSMCNIKIKPMTTFCSDEAPTKAGSLINQHCRWFGGCMKLLLSYKWSKSMCNKNPILQVLDGFYSQFLWAFSPYLILAGLLSILHLDNGFMKFLLINIYAICLLLYIYIIPYISCKLIQIKAEVRFIDWLALPVAIILKSVGPQLFFAKYIIGIITGNKLNFGKVER